jgi:hypothetical protein
MLEERVYANAYGLLIYAPAYEVVNRPISLLFRIGAAAVVWQ